MNWTAKAVEVRVLEAAETVMKLPSDDRSRVGNGWPDYIPHYPRAMKIRVPPSPGALSRMEQTWRWLSSHPVDSERRLLYKWAETKVQRGRKVNDFASREGINSRTLRWTITRICQAIADQLEQRKVPCFDQAVDDVAEIEPEPPSQTVSSETSATIENDGIVGFIEPGARPHYPTPAEIAALVKRLEKQNKLRRRRSKAGTA